MRLAIATTSMRNKKRVDVEKETMVANPPTPGRPLTPHAGDVAGERIRAHLVQDLEKEPLVFSGQFCEAFFCAF